MRRIRPTKYALFRPSFISNLFVETSELTNRLSGTYVFAQAFCNNAGVHVDVPTTSQATLPAVTTASTTTTTSITTTASGSHIASGNKTVTIPSNTPIPFDGAAVSVGLDGVFSLAAIVVLGWMGVGV
jgi:hypothetical protein